jgi:hypothetical protein
VFGVSAEEFRRDVSRKGAKFGSPTSFPAPRGDEGGGIELSIAVERSEAIERLERLEP